MLGPKEGATLNLCTSTSSLFQQKTKKDLDAETSCLAQNTRSWTKSRNQAIYHHQNPSEMALDIYSTNGSWHVNSDYHPDLLIMATDAWGPLGQSSLNRDDVNQVHKACRKQKCQEEEEKLLAVTVNIKSPLIYFI